MVIGSGAICFAVLYSNQAFSDEQIIKEDFGIVKKGTLPVSRGSRCHQPYIIIDFHGTEKQLVFVVS